MEGVSWTIRNEEQRQHLLNRMMEFPYPYQVRISEPSAPHTAQQLRYVHSLINALALHCGVSTEIAKRDAKVEWGITVVHRSILTGQKTARLLSFADYNRKQLSDFISHVEVYLAEEGVEFIASEDRGR